MTLLQKAPVGQAAIDLGLHYLSWCINATLAVKGFMLCNGHYELSSLLSYPSWCCHFDCTHDKVTERWLLKTLRKMKHLLLRSKCFIFQNLLKN